MLFWCRDHSYRPTIQLQEARFAKFLLQLFGPHSPPLFYSHKTVPHDFKNVTTTSKRPKTRPQGNNPSAIFSQLREFLTAEGSNPIIKKTLIIFFPLSLENYDPSSSDITTVSQPSYLKRFTWREAARIALGRLEDVPPPTTKPEKFASQTTIGSKPKTLTSPTKRRSHPKKEKPVQTALQIAISSFTDITAAPPYPLLRTTTISRNTIEKSVPTTPVADKELSAQGQTFLTQEQRGDTFDEGGAVNAPLAGIASYKHISISHYEEKKENEPCSETSFDRRQIPGSVEGDILPTAWTQYQLSVQTTNTCAISALKTIAKIFYILKKNN